MSSSLIFSIRFSSVPNFSPGRNPNPKTLEQPWRRLPPATKRFSAAAEAHDPSTTSHGGGNGSATAPFR
ncbi:hypothetical protein M6B38_283050 [Iris pallida]|uniref:Uncharacterized protein n=1 Tax=Iris pallida TaxID=29817 RepID=A0AAX6I161_IRIPA|nr:hypothetical protein M6B38_283050 [Iris pallida]